MTAPKPKLKTEDPTAWLPFWKDQFKMLKLRRGILQAEKLTREEIGVLIAEMILECQVAPYNEIDKVVLQRVISDAVLNDPDFIGFTVSWVRRTLNKYWHLGGYKLYDKIQREKEAAADALKQNVPTENHHEDINDLLERTRKRLLAEGRTYRAPSDFNEPVKGSAGDDGWFHEQKKAAKIKREHQSELNRLSSEFYKNRESLDLKQWEDDKGFYVLAESEKDAIEIYNLATKQ
jgi:hypothetical protein